MSEGDWSLRAGVFLENVMDTLQQAEEMDGLEGAEYVRAMFYLSNVCSERAVNYINRKLKELEGEV